MDKSVEVIVIKRINRRIPKNKRGLIAKKDLDTYGIGNEVCYPHQMQVEIDGIDQPIPNTLLNLPGQ